MKRCKDCPAAEDNYGGWLHCSLYDDYYEPEQKACTIEFIDIDIKEFGEIEAQTELVNKIKTWIRKK